MGDWIEPDEQTWGEWLWERSTQILNGMETAVVWCAVVILAYHCFFAIYGSDTAHNRLILRRTLEVLHTNWIGALILSGLLFYRLVCYKLRKLKDWSGKRFDDESGTDDYDKPKVSGGVEI